jgi:hypothetical protein
MVTRNFALAASLVLPLASGVSARVAADPLPECPPLIEVMQEVRNPPEGWSSVSPSGRQRLARVTFKLAADSGELHPDVERDAGGHHTMTWTVAGMNGLLLVCEYGGTLARLTRPVNGAVKQCEVVLSSTKPTSVPISAQCQ